MDSAILIFCLPEDVLTLSDGMTSMKFKLNFVIDIVWKIIHRGQSEGRQRRESFHKQCPSILIDDGDR